MPASKTVGEERSFEVQIGPLFGVDVRPSRVFVWTGADRQARRIVPLGRPPRTMVVPRRRRQFRAGPVEVTLLGNPLLTLGQAGISAARAARRGRRAISSGGSR
jgi:hypothetical protein